MILMVSIFIVGVIVLLRLFIMLLYRCLLIWSVICSVIIRRSILGMIMLVLFGMNLVCCLNLIFFFFSLIMFILLLFLYCGGCFCL